MFSVALDGRETPDEARAFAALADAAGARSLWISCHLFQREPAVVAALTLAATRRLGASLMAISPYSVHPVYAAMTAATLDEQFPGRVHVVRFEDIVVDPVGVLSNTLARIGVGRSETLARPTWNGMTLDQVYPWGTIRTPTPAANRATAEELSAAEKREIALRTKPLLGLLGYDAFLAKAREAA